MKKRFANAVKEGINEYYIKRVEEWIYLLSKDEKCQEAMDCKR